MLLFVGRITTNVIIPNADWHKYFDSNTLSGFGIGNIISQNEKQPL